MKVAEFQLKSSARKEYSRSVRVGRMVQGWIWNGQYHQCGVPLCTCVGCVVAKMTKSDLDQVESAKLPAIVQRIYRCSGTWRISGTETLIRTKHSCQSQLLYYWEESFLVAKDLLGFVRRFSVKTIAIQTCFLYVAERSRIFEECQGQLSHKLI